MKSILIALAAIVLFYGCKKMDDVSPVPPTAPTNLTAVLSGTTVNLIWTDNSDDEAGFIIERKTGAANYLRLDTVGANTTTYTDNVALFNTYIYRVSAYNANGVSTSNTDTVNTNITGVPVLTTNAVTDITGTTAMSGGMITNDGGSAITERGVVWSTTTNPDISLTTKTVDGSGTGSFTSDITGLTSNTTYYVRAYATNSSGTAYGQEETFTTIVPVAPTLTTTAVTAVTSNTATSGGDITSDGGSPITERGVVWSTTTNPDISLTTKTVDGTGTGTFTSSITGLLPTTTYYVRAYATNAIGTSYGQEETFTTPVQCNEANVVLADLLGDYDNTNEVLGTSTYGPYTTTITSAVSTGPTTARIAVTNIYDTNWGAIEFLLDWTDPNNRTAIVVPNDAIPNSDASDIGGTAGAPVAVRIPDPATTPGTFSYCGQTFSLKMQIGQIGLGWVTGVYIVDMAR